MKTKSLLFAVYFGLLFCRAEGASHHRKAQLLGYEFASDLRAAVPGRLPVPVSNGKLVAAGLAEHLEPIHGARSLHIAAEDHRHGIARLASGQIIRFKPQIALIKMKGAKGVGVLALEDGKECEAIDLLNSRPDVEFAEFDRWLERQHQPSDPGYPRQWHHTLLESPRAWEGSLGSKKIRVAVVDTPFQMDHPDLAANVTAGWDVISQTAIVKESRGLDHSTAGAGLIAAVIDNGLGIAGIGHVSVLPININGYAHEMYDAVIWAADNGVRVVNISWDGADLATLNEAGAYLRTKASGILVMPGVNLSTGGGYLPYPAHPDIYAISMTDEADNMLSSYGRHIDFAAPGFEVYTTTTNNDYAMVRGTSYSAPIFAGIVSVLFSINPGLTPETAAAILRKTAIDKGPPGWDQFYGWGRVRFAAAVEEAIATLAPLNISTVTIDYSGRVILSCPIPFEAEFILEETPALLPSAWTPVVDALQWISEGNLYFKDPRSLGELSGFFRVRAVLP